MDSAVKILRVSGATAFDPVTLLPSKSIIVTYTVGDHGPFTLTTPQAEFSPEYVDAETTKQANILRALGVVKTS